MGLFSNFALPAAAVLISTVAFGAVSPLPGPFGAKSTLLSPTVKAAAPIQSPKKSAAIQFTCSDLRRAALNMSAHTSNLLNRSTTRTPEGGPYKKLEVICKAAGGAFCDVHKVEDTQIVYEPKHPDADANGNVKYPVINTGNESAGLISAANEIKAIASQGVCGTKIIENGLLTIVKYDEGFEVMMDTITFTPDGRMARWSRTTREGRTQNLSFKDDGTPVTL